MSVSDPEEYLVSRSDEDVLFPQHSMYVDCNSLLSPFVLFPIFNNTTFNDERKSRSSISAHYIALLYH